MATPSGRPIDQPGRAITDALARDRKDIEQIKRELVKIPKPAAAPSAGGYLGSAQLASTPGAVQQGSGGTRIAEGNVTYAAPVDPHVGTGGEGLAPSGWCSVSGFQITLEEGWYSAAVMVDAAWATPANAPDYCSVYVAGVPNEIVEYLAFPASVREARKGFRVQVHTGPFYAGFGPLWVEVEFGSHAGTSDPLVGFGGSANASQVWTIIKHT